MSDNVVPFGPRILKNSGRRCATPEVPSDRQGAIDVLGQLAHVGGVLRFDLELAVESVKQASGVIGCVSTDEQVRLVDVRGSPDAALAPLLAVQPDHLLNAELPSLSSLIGSVR